MATYLITQATGQQAQWVIRHLLADGAKVHAVVRNPDKVPSTLQQDGVKIFKGDSLDVESIIRAAQGCKGAFLNTFPIPEIEGQQAQTIVDACKKAGIETVVATTTFFTGNKEMWNDADTEKVGLSAYFKSKAEVETIVRGAGFKSYTILRPAFIHFDYFLPSVLGNYPELPARGVLEHAFEDGAKMPHTDAHDIGKYGAAALQNPEKFAGEEIDLSNELLSAEDSRDIVARVSGRTVQVYKRSPEEIEEASTKVFAQRFHLWANHKDFTPTIKGAKEVQERFGIPFTSLEAALTRDKERLLDCVPA